MARPVGRHPDVRTPDRVSCTARRSTLRPSGAAPARTCGGRLGASSVARQAAEAWWQHDVVPPSKGCAWLCGDSGVEAAEADEPGGAGAVTVAPVSGGAACIASTAKASAATTCIHSAPRHRVSRAPLTTRSYEASRGMVQTFGREAERVTLAIPPTPPGSSSSRTYSRHDGADPGRGSVAAGPARALTRQRAARTARNRYDTGVVHREPCGATVRTGHPGRARSAARRPWPMPPRPPTDSGAFLTRLMRSPGRWSRGGCEEHQG